VVTATSRTGVDYLERMKRPSVYAVGFLPFDTMPLMKSLIKTFGISRLWLLETELWPSMLFACFRGKVPVGIANARIEEKSFASYLRLRRLFGPLLGQFDVVLAQNDTYAERFRRLGVRPECLHVVGNMKGHIIFHRPAPDKRAALRRAMHLDESDIVLTAGCFHRGEGGVLRACLDLLKGRCRAVKCIVVPRYLDESDALAAELGKAGLRRFADMVADAPWELCTVEKIGILEAMYSIADAAAVGGTFVDIGGHNVWEPARFGIPVFFGPHYHTQSSSCEKLLAAGTGFCVNDAKELADGIERTLWREKTIFAAAQSLFVEQITHDQMIAEPLIP
jgi:3-deoxy-D-manno-octulosonic-acid transferase